MPTSDPDLFQKIHLGVEVFLTIIIPIGAWSVGRVKTSIAQVAEEKTKALKASLDEQNDAMAEHERKDEIRFSEQAGKIESVARSIGDIREERRVQHKENAERLQSIQNELTETGSTLKAEVSNLTSWYQTWMRSKM